MDCHLHNPLENLNISIASLLMFLVGTETELPLFSNSRIKVKGLKFLQLKTSF